MVRLSVNVNKIALLRNSRGGDQPNVLQAARACLDAGCHGITVHPRPDARHITYQDVRELDAMLRAEYKTEFNIEGYPTDDFLQLVCEVKPAQATLVPDPPDALTSDQGWDFLAHHKFLHEVAHQLHDSGIRVSLFADADPTTIPGAAECHADRVELYTGPYAHAFGTPDFERVLKRASRERENREEPRPRHQCGPRSQHEESSWVCEERARPTGSINRPRIVLRCDLPGIEANRRPLSESDRRIARCQREADD